MDDQHEIMEENGTECANTEENSVGIPDKESYHKPLKRDPKTGKFIAGTGSRAYLGGRPKGAKDRVSQQLLTVAESLMQRRGAELLEEVADRAPEQALALITKIIPPQELQKLFEEDREGQKRDKANEVTIRVVSAPNDRQIEHRSEQEMLDHQRGLTHRIEPTEDDLKHVIEADDTPPWDEPEEPARPQGEASTQTPQEPTRADMDELAAQAARDRAQRQNDVIRAHGGLTGRRPRGSAPDTLDYPDDPSIV